MWKNFQYYRQALGINMLWNAYPIVIIVRDGFGFGPSGSTATIIFWTIGLFLLTPLNIFQRIYLPNKILSFFWLSFMTLCFIYLNYYTAHNYYYRITDLRETLNYLFPLLFLFGLLYYPNEHVDKILPVTVIFTLIASLLLAYIVFSNPNFNMGERIAVKYANTSNTTTNPHPFANNAVRCIIAAVLCSFMTKNFFLKIINYLIVILSVGILFLTRTNTSLYGMVVIVFIFLFLGMFRVNLRKIKFSTLAGLGAVLFAVNFALQQSARYRLLIDIYWGQISGRFFNTVYTALGIKIGGGQRVVTEDASSMGRVISWNYIKDMFQENKLADIIMGEGYRSQFLDIPVLEAFVNHGIIGFVLYNLCFLSMGVFTVKELFVPTTKMATFLAYYSIIIFLNVLTGAPVVDTGNWMSFIPFVRFLGIKYYETPSLSPAISTS